MTLAHTVMERCDVLATFTEEPGTITRPFATESMRRVNELVRGWMDEAGMTVTRDNIGSLRGRSHKKKEDFRITLEVLTEAYDIFAAATSAV